MSYVQDLGGACCAPCAQSGGSCGGAALGGLRDMLTGIRSAIVPKVNLPVTKGGYATTASASPAVASSSGARVALIAGAAALGGLGIIYLARRKRGRR